MRLAHRSQAVVRLAEEHPVTEPQRSCLQARSSIQHVLQAPPDQQAQC